MLKWCGICSKPVPAEQYERHRRRHRHTTRSKGVNRQAQARARKQALKLANYQCQAEVLDTRCPKTVGLELHHIDGDWRNNDPSNWAIVCHDHHPRGGNNTQRRNK